MGYVGYTFVSMVGRSELGAYGTYMLTVRASSFARSLTRSLGGGGLTIVRQSLQDRYVRRIKAVVVRQSVRSPDAYGCKRRLGRVAVSPISGDEARVGTCEGHSLT